MMMMMMVVVMRHSELGNLLLQARVQFPTSRLTYLQFLHVSPAQCKVRVRATAAGPVEQFNYSLVHLVVSAALRKGLSACGEQRSAALAARLERLELGASLRAVR